MSDYCEYGTVVRNMFRISVSETYELEDCDYYSTTVHSSTVDLNKTLLNVTGCTVEFDLVFNGSGGTYLDIGTDANNYIGVGSVGSGNYGFFIQHNNARETSQFDSGLGSGTYHAVFTYNNGSMTSLINNKTKTYTFTQPIDKILNANCWGGSQLKNIKVKAL